MADYLALNQYSGTGAVMQVEISFTGNRPDASAGAVPYFKAADVLAEVEKPATSTTNKVITPMTLTQVNSNTFRTTSAVPIGSILRVYRKTEDKYPLVDFNALQNVTERDLDNLTRQAVFMSGEAKDVGNLARADASTAVIIAVLANNTANAASAAAALAIGTANSANSTAQSALTGANNASSVAAAASSTANSANSTAVSALASAVAAVNAANSANSQAGAAYTRAQQASFAAEAARIASANAESYVSRIESLIAGSDSAAALAVNLAGPEGAERVSFDGLTMGQIAKTVRPLADYTELRAYTGVATVVEMVGPDFVGRFRRLGTGTGAVDDGGVTIVSSNGVAWKRVYSGEVHVDWFGAKGDGVTNDTPAFQRAVNYLRKLGGGTIRFNKRHLFDTNLFVEDYITVHGELMAAGELRYDGTSDYDGKQSLILLNPAATITLRSGATFGQCIVLPKGLDLPFANAAAAQAAVNAFAGTVFTAGGSDPYIHNMLVIGFEFIFKSNNFERPRADHIQGDCTNGIWLSQVYDIAYVDRCHLWPFSTTHRSWTTGPLNERAGVGFKFDKVGDWSKLTNCFTYGYAKGFDIDGCNFVNLVGCGTDGYGPGASTSIGFHLRGISKMPTMVACQMAAQGRGLVIDNNVGGLNSTAALSNIIGCAFWDNDIKHADVLSGAVNFVSCGLWRAPIGIDAQPIARVSVDLCYFEDITAGALSSGSFDNFNIGPSNRFINCVNNFGVRRVIEANPTELLQFSGNTPDGIGLQVRKSRGTTAAKTALVENDIVFNWAAFPYDGVNFISGGGLRQVIRTSVAAGNLGTAWILSARAAGANNSTDYWVFERDGSFKPGTMAAQDLGATDSVWRGTYSRNLYVGSSAATLITSGTGTPEGVVVAPVGSMFLRSDGAAGTLVYIKQTGTGNTGWIAKL